jgi:hypothetical protein
MNTDLEVFEEAFAADAKIRKENRKLYLKRSLIIFAGILAPLISFRSSYRSFVLERVPAEHKAAFELFLGSDPIPHQHGGHGTSSEKKASAAGQAQDEMVLIEGQYFKKSPDNVYIVNGKKVFFK